MTVGQVEMFEILFEHVPELLSPSSGIVHDVTNTVDVLLKPQALM